VPVPTTTALNTALANTGSNSGPGARQHSRRRR
jgi:hypothetical protein